jgi:hypothetical protein
MGEPCWPFVPEDRPPQSNPWGLLAVQILPGLIIGLAVSMADSGRHDDRQTAAKLQEIAIQMGKNTETLVMVCKQLEEKNKRDSEQDLRLNNLEANQARILQRLNMAP